MDVSKDYYLILGVRPGASIDEIKSGYRQRALEVHPDQSGSDSGRFLAVREAYEVLGDPVRRKEYDEQRQAVQGGFRFSGERRRGREEEWAWSARSSGNFGRRYADSFHGDKGDSMEDFLERARRQFGLWREEEAIELVLSRGVARRGGVVRVQVPVLVECPDCAGKGARGFRVCQSCLGAGGAERMVPIEIEVPAGQKGGELYQVSLRESGLEGVIYLRMRVK